MYGLTTLLKNLQSQSSVFLYNWSLQLVTLSYFNCFQYATLQNFSPHLLLDTSPSFVLASTEWQEMMSFVLVFVTLCICGVINAADVSVVQVECQIGYSIWRINNIHRAEPNRWSSHRLHYSKRNLSSMHQKLILSVTGCVTKLAVTDHIVWLNIIINRNLPHTIPSPPACNKE